ncbi:MAG: enoyl-CoA hydratase [Actinobacteria bacterium]|nr:enoyl-CoA hydratase [Actinomycetota bacterium]
MITLEVADRVAVVTLNDPDRRNVVSNALNDAVLAAMDELEARSDVGALVVTGAGSAFCAGADLEDLANCDSEEKLRTIYSGFLRLAGSSLPTVAAVNGPAVGAGLNLALACDVILAGASARFDTRFLQIGLHPGGGNTWRLRRITDLQSTMAMVLFGEVIDGPRAAEIGLAWRCVPDADLLAEAQTLAARAAAGPPELVRRMKATILGMDAVTNSDDAVSAEIGPQLWSLGEPAFVDLLARLRAQIAAKS